MEIRAIRGMNDLFGSDLENWLAVEKKIETIFGTFGYREIRTPVVEDKRVFSQTVGDDSDIVQKQMYEVKGSADESLVLRPEGTASFVRAVLEHGLHNSNHPQRYFYSLPMFRYERPQKGRLRQFYQCGAELINDPTPAADAEIVILLDSIYQTLKVPQYTIKINSVGCEQCRPSYRDTLKAYFRPHLPSLCAECQKRYERSVMRILDCKNESCQALAKTAPKLIDNLCAICKEHHVKFRTCLIETGTKFEEDPTIVRGLDYYSQSAFEFTTTFIGAQNSLAGGGRYDGMATRFGAKPFPGVGFALGMERLMLALAEGKVLHAQPLLPLYSFLPVGPRAFEILYPLSFELKRHGVWVEMNYDADKSLKSQLKTADRSGASFALILGDTEIENGMAILKNMKQHTQELVSIATLQEELLGRKAL